SFNIDYNDGLFIINMKDFALKDTDLKFTGLIQIDPSKINLDASSDLIVKNLILTFDKKLKNIKADTVFVNYHNNTFNLSFIKPSYEDVLLERSKVSYSIEKNVLKLYLKTQSLFNNTIKNILSYYGVDIDTIQYDGTNDISTNIFIPFDKGDIYVDADIGILNSNLEDFGHKYKVNKSVLTYKDNIITGKTDLNHIKYKDIEINNSFFTYKIDITNNLKLDLTSDTVHFTKDTYNFHTQNTSLQFENDKIIVSSDIFDNNKKTHIKLNNTTDLTTKKLSGSFNLQYDDTYNNISFSGKKILYKGSYNEDLNVSIQSNDIKIIQPYPSTIKELSVKVQKDEIISRFTLKDEENTHTLNIANTTNLIDKISYGNIGIERLIFKDFVNIKDKNIPYQAFFEDSIIFNSAIFGFTYYKSADSKREKIIISNPNKFLKPLHFLSVDKKSNGFIEIESENLKNPFIKIEDLNINLNTTYFESKENNTTEDIVLPKFPKIDLQYRNSHVKYDEYTLSFDTLNIKTDNNTTSLDILKEKSIIKINTEGDRIMFNASNLTDKYIDNFLNKELLEGGYVDINIYGDTINKLSGDINFYDTTVKNVTLINSLTTFVNTTPAIINPLLALPTLFRLAETGFDTNGYYMKHGDGSFRYNLAKKELDIYDLYTNGKMSNFIVNSHTNLSTKKIDANVDISFLKDFTTALNHIPLVGYIIMGDDGEFHTSVDITGTTDDPELETHTVKEATNGFTGIIKRILTLPLKPFQTEVTEEQKKKHNERVKELLNPSN
ncbi:AsmA-like C-terminal domain-containing protein, partial [Arcobacteraceae bacterium]|nr:AsmA-like C-terminal domain-containing protein [Arcobacteraceae bacterium]